jgi:zinc protease
VWHTVKGWAPDDAALNIAAYILTGAKNSRLTQTLVYEKQIASSVSAYQSGKRLDGDFSIIATAKPGHTLPELKQVIDAQLAKLAAEGPSARELEQAKNSIEGRFLSSMESARGKADRLNAYYYQLGNPDGFQLDLDRHRAVTAADVQRVVKNYLTAPRVNIAVVPQGKRDLADAGRVTQ